MKNNNSLLVDYKMETFTDNCKANIIKYDKTESSENYLDDLYNFLMENVNDDLGNKKIKFTLFNPHYSEALINCPFFFFVKDNFDELIQKLKDFGNELDTDSDNEEELSPIIKAMIDELCKIDENSSFARTKKGIFIYLSEIEYGCESFLFIDDLGTKFRLEANGKIFDSREY